MSDEDTIDPKEPMLLAGEYVLGVLSARERTVFEGRLAREPALRRQVEYWEGRLGGLAAEIAPIDPPPHVWANVQAALAARPARNRLWSNLVFWRWATLGSAALAAASLIVLMVVFRGPAPNAPLIAKLEATGGQASFVASVDPGGGGLSIVPASVVNTNQRVLELWLIAPGDRPHSLGLIEPGQAVHINLPVGLKPRLTAQAMLAISLEPPGGSPTGLPTGPVVASGTLTNL
jgi:anti-sigma-K factor RskA